MVGHSFVESKWLKVFLVGTKSAFQPSTISFDSCLEGQQQQKGLYLGAKGDDSTNHRRSLHPPQPVAMATGTPDAVKASVDEVTHEEVVGVWTITTYLRASSASACDANSVASRRDNRLTSVRDDKDRCGVCMVISSYFQRSKRSLRMALSSSPIGTGCHLKRICHSARRTLKSSTKS